MRIQATSGSAAAALGIIGTGLALALPDEKWIGWLLVAAGVLVFLFDIRIEGWRPRIGRKSSAEKRMNPFVLAVLFTGAAVGTWFWYFYDTWKGPIEWGNDDRPFGLEIEGRLRKQGEPVEIYVYGFSFNGRNRSGKTIYRIEASVTPDRTRISFPLYVLLDGQWMDLKEIKKIDSGRKFTIGCQTRADTLHCGTFTGEMTPEQFLKEIGSFTFSLSLDGKSYRYPFSVSDLEKQFESYRIKYEAQLNRPSDEIERVH